MQLFLKVNDTILRQAMAYTERKGLDLSVLIENLLLKWTKEQALEEKIKNYPISDEIKKLQGCLKVEGDFDYDKAKDEYFKEKYSL